MVPDSPIVQKGLKLCIQDELSPTEAAAKLLANTDVDEDEYALFAETGLRVLIGTALHFTRTEQASERGRFNQSPQATLNASRLAGICYQAGDGAVKSLLDFTPEDLSYLYSTFAARARSYSERGEWARKVAVLCVKHKATTVKRLPAQVLAKIQEQAEVLW